MSILGGFVPVAGPAISGAGAIASGVGTFLSTANAASNDPLEAQKTFAEQVLNFYKSVPKAMDHTVTRLFEGKQIPEDGPGSFNITDMLKDGAWIDPDVLTPVSDLNAKIRLEILSRSIDALWKVWPYNKMWVLFTDLQNDTDTAACELDNTGPRDSKYCDDGVSGMCEPSSPSTL